MAKATLAALLRERRIEAVSADPPAARSRVEVAKRHLASAKLLITSDPTAAYSLLYDAARKAVTAHMLANGYRTTGRPGAHQAAALYAEATLATGLAHARAIVAAVEADLPASSQQP